MIDFDGLFKAELLKRLRAGEDPETLEDLVPDLFLEWLDTPNAAANGLSPNAYFYAMDANALIDALCGYVSEEKGLPDPLLNALEDAADSEAPLYDLLQGHRGSFDRAEQLLSARRAAAELLNQKGSVLPVGEYLAILKAPTENPGLNEAAFAGLAALGEGVREQLLAALKGATDDAADCLLDLLSGLPQRDKRVFDQLLRHFRGRYERRGYFASLLARYGNPAALPALEEALSTVGYADYRILCEAIESLGGTVSLRRNFVGDPDFEELRRQKREQAQNAKDE